MHMADALLSPATGGVMLVISGALIAGSAHSIRKNFNESRIPLMGVAGAFVMAAQMINFTIPGTGSSGHIAGAILLSALLGSAPAFIVMAGVLLVQALFFADGGLLAFGCNLFNMGFFGCYLAYPYIFKPLAGKEMKPGRVFAGAIAASMVSLELGALAVTVETLVSGVTELPFTAFVLAMLPIHLAIGLGEGLATGAALLFVRKNLPDCEQLKGGEAPFSMLRLTWVFALAAAVIGGGLSLIASKNPDGLEWSVARLTGSPELDATGTVHAFFARLSDFFVLLPDYAFPGGESALGTIVSGLAGALICAVLIYAAVRLILHKRKHVTP